MKFLSLIVAVLAAVHYASCVDYCDSSLCQNSKHIACGHDGKFASTCPSDAKMVDLTPSLQALLVKAHNTKRNLVAGGTEPKHSAACRSATMQWDSEMAAIAAYNVRQCAMKHDACRNTKTFHYSGQNLAWMGYFEPVNDQALLNQAVDMWYSEIKDSNMTFINKYPKNYVGPAIGHFTVMVAERNIRLGCAAATYSVEGQSYKAYLLACNYATTNMVDFAIYKSCPKPATGCSTGTNPSYPNLCSTAEQFDVNKWF